MNYQTLLKTSAFALLAAFAAGRVVADIVETKNGARLVGTVKSVDGTNVVLDTDYAGELKVKQGEVVAITTDKSVNVRLSSGTVLEGTISPAAAGDGAVTIAGKDGTLNTNVAKISATWTPGGKDPAILALERHWQYEASVDITGKTGNSEALGTSFRARAILKTPEDTLEFYTGYIRQESDHVKSADQFKAGVDYQNNFAGRYSWYARDEGGFDRLKDIELYNIAAAGLGYDFLKQPKKTVTGRAGVSYRYEGYKNPMSEDVKSAGLDLGLNTRLEFERSEFVDKISYVPAFDDFASFRFIHEAYYEIPMKDPRWKVRFGILNDYNSEPGVRADGTTIEKLDTTYFTRLVLNWK